MDEYITISKADLENIIKEAGYVQLYCDVSGSQPASTVYSKVGAIRSLLETLASDGEMCTSCYRCGTSKYEIAIIDSLCVGCRGEGYSLTL